MSKKTKAKISTGSVYHNLGYQNPEEMETKANLTIEISKTIKNKKLTQKQAAEILSLTQPKLSELLRGHFRGYSVERLMNFLNILGNDVDIIVRPNPKIGKARTKVLHFNDSPPINAPMVAKGTDRK